MRREVPVLAIGKGDPDVAAKVFPVNGPSALELYLEQVSRTALAVLAAQYEIDPVVIDGQERIVPAFHRQRDKPLAVDHLDHVARRLFRICHHDTHRRQ